MRILFILLLSSELAYETVEGQTARYDFKPDWADLDKRPLPKWYHHAKVGISIHWGVYSVPSCCKDNAERFWFIWNNGKRSNASTYYGNDSDLISMAKSGIQVKEFMKKHYAADFTYQDFAADFKLEFFNASKWAQLFKVSGAKYVILTGKHEDGFALWRSKHSFSWNSVDTGPRRDIVGELSKKVTKQGLKFGLFYSMKELFNPFYMDDEKNKFRTQTFPPMKTWPELKQIVHEYNLSVLWINDDGKAPDTYWNSTILIADFYNKSPKKDEIVVNNNWGVGSGVHGDIRGCQNSGDLEKHKCHILPKIEKKSWGYRRNADLLDYMKIEEILKNLIIPVSCGGNVEFNFGATKEGMIIPIVEDLLMDLGRWLKINGEAIYDTSPWIKQKDSFNGNVWYTCKREDYDGLNPTAPPAKGSSVLAVYVITLRWPDKEDLIVQDIAPFMRQGTEVTLLGGKTLEWQYIDKGARIKIKFPYLPPSEDLADKKAWAVKVVFGKGACHELHAQYC